tara:strand:- start:8209 stop:9012 length:804 start_codon:yes stop_codon:yes gene_type:complete
MMIKHKLDLRYEGAELGVGSVLKRNDEKTPKETPTIGADKFLQTFTQFEKSVRGKSGKIYEKPQFIQNQKDYDGNWGFQKSAAAMKYDKTVNQFTLIPTKDSKRRGMHGLNAVMVEKAECDVKYGTARTMVTDGMKDDAKKKIAYEEKKQADKVGFAKAGYNQYGFSHRKFLDETTRINTREMSKNLVVTTQDQHTIDMEQYRDNYGYEQSKMDKALDIKRNPEQDPNYPRNEQPLNRFNVVEAEASNIQAGYQRNIGDGGMVDKMM